MKSNFVYQRFNRSPPVGHFFFVFLFFSEKNPVCRDRTHVPTCQRVTRYLLSYRGDRPTTRKLLNFFTSNFFTAKTIFTSKIVALDVKFDSTHDTFSYLTEFDFISWLRRTALKHHLSTARINRYKCPKLPNIVYIGYIYTYIYIYIYVFIYFSLPTPLCLFGRYASFSPSTIHICLADIDLRVVLFRYITHYIFYKLL